MAQPTNTFDTYDAIGNREDLADIIYDISPTETPFVNGVGVSVATAVLHEWQTDALAAADGDNAHVEGDDIDATAADPTVRENNRTQISRKSVTISGTQEAVDKAGRASEMAYQIAKRGRELKRDMEAILTGNQAVAAGNSSTARKLRSLEAWYKTNVSRGATGANGSASAAATDGTVRPYTEALLKDVLQQCYESGGEPGVIMSGSKLKQVSSGFAGGSTRTDKSEDKKVVAAVDIYESDFGTLRFVPNRFQRARTVHALQMDMWSVAYLPGRKFKMINLAKSGDSEKKAMLSEYTLAAKNEASSGVIADLIVPE